MKSIKCKVDDLGRITLPIQYRRALAIEPHDKVDIEFKDKGIFVFKQTEKEILISKLDDVMFAAHECKEVSQDEMLTLTDIFTKLVKEGAE
jgi:bifunctional DNA-binding transcriptional regulator/antitoxin component of YhaV-PrlF toxin-antitoxin module